MARSPFSEWGNPQTHVAKHLLSLVYIDISIENLARIFLQPIYIDPVRFGCMTHVGVSFFYIDFEKFEFIIAVIISAVGHQSTSD
jgi:hypothetical protein